MLLGCSSCCLPVAAASMGFCSCIRRDPIDGSVVVVCDRSINPLHSDCCFEFLFSPFFWSPICLFFCWCFFGKRFDQGCVDCFRLWGGGSDQPEWWVKSLDSIFWVPVASRFNLLGAHGRRPLWSFISFIFSYLLLFIWPLPCPPFPALRDTHKGAQQLILFLFYLFFVTKIRWKVPHENRAGTTCKFEVWRKKIHLILFQVGFFFIIICFIFLKILLFIWFLHFCKFFSFKFFLLYFPFLVSFVSIPFL